MSQAGQVDLDRSVGYILKRAQSALHTALETRLRTHGLSVSQYACLELLAQRPDLSQSELARGAFVTRQAMHQLVAGLQRTIGRDGREFAVRITGVLNRQHGDADLLVACTHG